MVSRLGTKVQALQLLAEHSKAEQPTEPIEAVVDLKEPKTLSPEDEVGITA